MKNILMTALLASALTGLSAYGADEDTATTQPAKNVDTFVMVSPNADVEKAVRIAMAGKTEKGAWLGVSTSPAPVALLKQLKIKSGLVIDNVVAGSPAETAGLKPQDIIQKLDDQLLINPSQLEGLIRMHDVGDSINLALLHEGDHTSATAKLVEHELLAVREFDPQRVADVFVQGFPGGNAVNFGGPDNMKFFGAKPGTNPQVHVMTGTSTTTNNNGVSSFQSQFSDGKLQFTMVRDGDKHVLTVKDSDGKQLFQGPVDTADQQNSIPQDLLGKFREMQKMEHMTDGVLNP